MAMAANEDPAKVESYAVKPRSGRGILALLGCVVFVALGIWMMADAETNVGEKAFGLLAVAFFGWCGVLYVQRMRRGAPIMLSHKGLHYAFAPHYGVLRLIPWRDIEGFGQSSVKNQQFNLIRLRSSDALARQFSDAEAAATLKAYRGVMGFANATAVVAGANMEFSEAGEAAELTKGSGVVKSLASMLRFNREKFGGEICLGWPDRDRSAAAFDTLLTAWKAYSTKV